MTHWELTINQILSEFCLVIVFFLQQAFHFKFLNPHDRTNKPYPTIIYTQYIPIMNDKDIDNNYLTYSISQKLLNPHPSQPQQLSPNRGQSLALRAVSWAAAAATAAMNRAALSPWSMRVCDWKWWIICHDILTVCIPFHYISYKYNIYIYVYCLCIFMLYIYIYMCDLYIYISHVF